MLARRLLLVVLAVAAAAHASAQCLSEPRASILQSFSNSIPSAQQPCFDTLAVVLQECSITVTSRVDGCGWLQLSGSFTGNPGPTVQASGPLSDAADAPAVTFEFSMRGNYDYIQLAIVGEADTNQASYKVVSGRLLQIQAAYNTPVADLNGPSGTASTSTANCAGWGTLTRVAVSKSCPSMLNSCYSIMAASVSGCWMSLTSNQDSSSCADFQGWISSAGTQAALSVTYSTYSRSQSAPAGGRKMLQSSRLARGGRMLKQSLANGAPWSLSVMVSNDGRRYLVLRQGNCGLFYTVNAPGNGNNVLGVE